MTFHEWMREQISREDHMGAFAWYTSFQPESEHWPNTRAVWLELYYEGRSVAHVLDTINAAWNEYDNFMKGLK